MRLGSQRNLFTIQRKVTVGLNELREPNVVWQDWRTDVYCEVTVRRGKEQFDASSKQRYSEEVWQFRTRFDEVVGADASMRLMHEGQEFNIKAILPDGQMHRDCVIECTVADSQLNEKPLAIEIREIIPKGKAYVAFKGFSASAKGGKEPYAFSAGTDTLPPGLTIDAATGKVSGLPTSAGSYDVLLFVVDAAGESSTLPLFPIVVEAS